MVGATAADGRPAEIAWLRLGLSQLASVSLSQVVSDRVSALDAVLAGSQARLDAVRARAAGDESRRTLKERILQRLSDGPARPRDLAAQCDSDAYQVSRALRELTRMERVEVAEAQRDEAADGRGVWYRIAPQGVAVADEKVSIRRPLQIRISRVGSFTRGVRIRPIIHDVDVWSDLGATSVVDSAAALHRLAAAWIHVLLEEGLPSGATPSNLDSLNESQRIPDEFTANHDLARLLQVGAAAPIWLSREGTNCWILTGSSATQAPMADVVAELEELGETLKGVVDAVDSSSGSNPLPNVACIEWARRSDRPIEARIGVATALEPAVISEISGDEDVAEFWEYGDFLQGSELLAAARMASGLQSTAVRELLATVRRCPRVDTPDLDVLAVRARSAMDAQAHLRPYEQGYFLADWLRSDLGVAKDGPIDPAAVLAGWGVPVTSASTDQSIDAFACWGPRHGPTVVINEDGKHSRSAVGRRASLAHEIAHLLVDRTGALPLAEVLGGKTAPIAEARAGAFAAELLLPRDEAGRIFSRSTNPR